MSYEEEKLWRLNQENKMRNKAIAASGKGKKETKRKIVIDDRCAMMCVDNRFFFTEKKNLKYLMEAAVALNGGLAIVHVDSAELLSLKEIAAGINATDFVAPMTKYRVIKTRVGKIKRGALSPVAASNTPSVESIIAKAVLDVQDVQVIEIEPGKASRSEQIRGAIRREMLRGVQVSINSLTDVLKGFDLSKEQIRYYFNQVKRSMEEEGFGIEKTARGQYLAEEVNREIHLKKKEEVKTDWDRLMRDAWLNSYESNDAGDPYEGDDY